jgi:hypothetical protein
MSDMMGGLPGGEKIQFENNIFVIICPFTSSEFYFIFFQLQIHHQSCILERRAAEVHAAPVSF